MRFSFRFRVILLAIISFAWACSQTLPVATEKVALGHHLFFETALSANGTKSCASCHAPQFAFTDGYKRSLGMVADLHKHNAQSLLNSRYYKHLNWANVGVVSFEEQMQRPLFGTTPLEMGASLDSTEILSRLKQNPLYQNLFKKAFPNSTQPITWKNILNSIAEYEKTLVSFNSPYDRYKNGDETALSPLAKKGEDLFFSHKLKCMTCHTVPMFSMAADSIQTEPPFFNIGLYNVGNSNTYPKGDGGLSEETHRDEDNGKFRVPSLRNIGFTAPYMHDGSVATLSEVIDIYARGGRKIEYGEMQGDGKDNTLKDNRIHGFEISASEKQALIAFLLSLNDSSIFKNPQFLPPVP